MVKRDGGTVEGDEVEGVTGGTTVVGPGRPVRGLPTWGEDRPRPIRPLFLLPTDPGDETPGP